MSTLVFVDSTVCAGADKGRQISGLTSALRASDTVQCELTKFAVATFALVAIKCSTGEFDPLDQRRLFHIRRRRQQPDGRVHVVYSESVFVDQQRDALKQAVFVAGMSMFRFIASTLYLIVRLFGG